MTNWQEKLQIDHSAGAPPLYKQIAQFITELISSGEIPSGEQLPSVRELSHKIGVNRGIVTKAYRFLAEKNILQTHVGQGTKVMEAPVQSAPSKTIEQLEERVNRLAPYPLVKEGLYSFSSASPETQMIPIKEISQAISLLLERESHLFSYSSISGDDEFRLLYSQYLKEFGLLLNPEQILPINGATQGWDLVSKLLEPNDLIFIEEPSNLSAWRSFALRPLKILPLPTSKDGLEIDELKKRLSSGQIPRLIFLTSDFHNPTGASLTAEKREELAWLAQRFDFLILEEAILSPLFYENKPPADLLKLAPERTIRVDSFSKTFAPGLRLGTIAAHPRILACLSLIKGATDTQTTLLSQIVIREALKSGFWEKHLMRLRDHYKEKRDLLLSSLKQYFQGQATWSSPQGGFFIWVTFPQEIDSRDLLVSSLLLQTSFVPGDFFSFFHNYRNSLRLSFSAIKKEDIPEGIRRLREALSTIVSGQSTLIPLI